MPANLPGANPSVTESSSSSSSMDAAGPGAAPSETGPEAILASQSPAAAADDGKPTGLGRAAVSGSIVNTLAQLCNAGVVQLLQIVLAWFLAPGEFGLIALAGTFTTFVQILREFGAMRVLVQRGRE